MSILLAALLVSADPAVAQAPAPVQAPATAQKVEEKQVCRIDTSDSSSRLRKRVCMTQSEWDRKAAGVSADDLKSMGAR